MNAVFAEIPVDRLKVIETGIIVSVVDAHWRLLLHQYQLLCDGDHFLNFGTLAYTIFIYFVFKCILLKHFEKYFIWLLSWGVCPFVKSNMQWKMMSLKNLVSPSLCLPTMSIHKIFLYSCNNITTTLIQISRLFYFGFFSKTNHQMMI